MSERECCQKVLELRGEIMKFFQGKLKSIIQDGFKYEEKIGSLHDFILILIMPRRICYSGDCATDSQIIELFFNSSQVQRIQPVTRVSCVRRQYTGFDDEGLDDEGLEQHQADQLVVVFIYSHVRSGLGQGRSTMSFESHLVRSTAPCGIVYRYAI